jgi:hypothetical protein
MEKKPSVKRPELLVKLNIASTRDRERTTSRATVSDWRYGQLKAEERTKK